MLQISSLKHSFENTELSYPDWHVDKGEHAAILGNSGSGKTTLLHLIGGLMQPERGSVKINGQEMAELKGSKLDRFRGANIGIVFQKPHLVRSLTVRENISLAQTLSKASGNKRDIDDLLESLDIAALRDRKVYQISQGQAQRVSIARALVNAPKLLLADEPTASLDDENCSRVIQLFKSQAKEKQASLIVATHDQRVKSEFQNQLSL